MKSLFFMIFVDKFYHTKIQYFSGVTMCGLTIFLLFCKGKFLRLDFFNDGLIFRGFLTSLRCVRNDEYFRLVERRLRRRSNLPPAPIRRGVIPNGTKWNEESNLN